MPNKCSVLGCYGRGGFSFPPKSDTGRRQKWKEVIKISWDPSSYSTVCEFHFKPEDFKDSIRADNAVEPAKKKRRVLKSTVVPSIFSWPPVKVDPADDPAPTTQNPPQGDQTPEV